nr:hypothetical protein [Sulfurospirillum sp. 'SP']
MKKILAYTFLSATFLLSGVLENSYTKEDFEKIDNRSGEEIAKSIAEEESKNLPKIIDNIEITTNVMAINTKIYYKKEIMKENDKTVNEMLSNEKTKKIILNKMYIEEREKLCKNKLTKEYINKKEIAIQTDYYESKNKEHIGSYSIDKSDCIKMEQEQKSKGKYSLY